MPRLTQNSQNSPCRKTRVERTLANKRLIALYKTMPDTGNPEEKFYFDRQQAFLIYAKFTGDVEKTAHSLNVSPLDIISIAKSEGWDDKLAAIIKLKKSGKPGDIERGINRALNFVQAHRMRCFLERMVCKLENMSDEELFEYCFQETVKQGKDGSVTKTKGITTRPFADLASALEKVHATTYAALSDTAADRTARKEQQAGEETTTQEIHSAISKAMAEARANTPAGLLFDAQLDKGQAKSSPPVTPLERVGTRKKP